MDVYESTLSRDGRLWLRRETVERRTDAEFALVCSHPNWRLVVVLLVNSEWSISRFSRHVGTARPIDLRLLVSDIGHISRLDRLVAGVAPAQLNEGGRIFLPKGFRRNAQIEDVALVADHGTHLQLWNPILWSGQRAVLHPDKWYPHWYGSVRSGWDLVDLAGKLGLLPVFEVDVDPRGRVSFPEPLFRPFGSTMLFVPDVSEEGRPRIGVLHRRNRRGVQRHGAVLAGARGPSPIVGPVAGYQLSRDASGRVLCPSPLLEFAEINRCAMVYGVLKLLEVWSPHHLAGDGLLDDFDPEKLYAWDPDYHETRSPTSAFVSIPYWADERQLGRRTTSRDWTKRLMPSTPFLFWRG